MDFGKPNTPVNHGNRLYNIDQNKKGNSTLNILFL